MVYFDDSQIPHVNNPQNVLYEKFPNVLFEKFPNALFDYLSNVLL